MCVKLFILGRVGQSPISGATPKVNGTKSLIDCIPLFQGQKVLAHAHFAFVAVLKVSNPYRLTVGKKLRGPSQNSPRVASKGDVNITMMCNASSATIMLLILP
ncbi:hypothetical protein AVEN_120003-1 [Araneus ventricosus]|uniref:Uncharacterized protein n=1 Tax=Araneus ventricosus TaxID=182803 RepID=A0A4Y2LWA8_ARAVE|nr:hypothetical protein AVEN_120003-1 [Araneus ventricosus]